ncbi:MAG: DoxX family membrane protein [Flavobacteriaceae bacterium]|nr:DoxX family membrane protein [Flavobacteriaceae bacterium]
MNSKVLMVIRIIFALALLFFGANKFFHFMDPPPPPEAAMGYWAALSASKTMALVAIVEIAAGLALLLNKYAALMMLILMSVSINAVLYHATLDSASIMMAIVLLVLNIVMLYAYKDKYKELFS